MESNKTVILGEASEDSDSEEIILNDGPSESCNQRRLTLTKVDEVDEINRFHNSSPFSAISSPSSTLARIVQYTSSYNPFTYSPKRGTMPKTASQNLSLLHRTLFTKNQQLYACVNHLYRHPLEKASKDVHNISHRLVNIQKDIQEIDTAVAKIGREQRNLDIKIDMFT